MIAGLAAERRARRNAEADAGDDPSSPATGAIYDAETNTIRGAIPIRPRSTPR